SFHRATHGAHAPTDGLDVDVPGSVPLRSEPSLPDAVRPTDGQARRGRLGSSEALHRDTRPPRLACWIWPQTDRSSLRPAEVIVPTPRSSRTRALTARSQPAFAVPPSAGRDGPGRMRLPNPLAAGPGSRPTVVRRDLLGW